MVQDLNQDQDIKDQILNLDCGDLNQMVQITGDSDLRHQRDKIIKGHRENERNL